eukprot:TRINITY_DN70119_c0_g1_i1.p1 TRINITY_DN70119_c0_g1~~TRINITY_DN70119_c0_g1_i1.p1  ORF type:complete len:441 (+),score=152.25 TRINITY_DN70119_c0_g1_i1:93-1325(+)
MGNEVSCMCRQEEEQSQLNHYVTSLLAAGAKIPTSAADPGWAAFGKLHCEVLKGDEALARYASALLMDPHSGDHPVPGKVNLKSLTRLLAGSPEDAANPQPPFGRCAEGSADSDAILTLTTCSQWAEQRLGLCRTLLAEALLKQPPAQGWRGIPQIAQAAQRCPAAADWFERIADCPTAGPHDIPDQVGEALAATALDGFATVREGRVFLLPTEAVRKERREHADAEAQRQAARAAQGVMKRYNDNLSEFAQSATTRQPAPPSGDRSVPAAAEQQQAAQPQQEPALEGEAKQPQQAVPAPQPAVQQVAEEGSPQDAVPQETEQPPQEDAPGKELAQDAAAAEMASEPSAAAGPERRRDPTERDGPAYTHAEFISFYGAQHGSKKWEEAAQLPEHAGRKKRRGSRRSSRLG